jgi:hypothetical protein
MCCYARCYQRDGNEDRCYRVGFDGNIPTVAGVTLTRNERLPVLMDYDSNRH